MTTPTLYVKTGCPYCKAATDFLDEKKISYEQVDVLKSESAMTKMREISGQTKTPTLDWDGDVLADFGVKELEAFLEKHPTSG